MDAQLAHLKLNVLLVSLVTLLQKNNVFFHVLPHVKLVILDSLLNAYLVTLATLMMRAAIHAWLFSTVTVAVQPAHWLMVLMNPMNPQLFV